MDQPHRKGEICQSVDPFAGSASADIGGPKSRVLLAEIATGSGPMAAAAYESLDLLDQIDDLGAPE
jgi:hypothetical protein